MNPTESNDTPQVGYSLLLIDSPVFLGHVYLSRLHWSSFASASETQAYLPFQPSAFLSFRVM